MQLSRVSLSLVVSLGVVGFGHAQLRVGTWNITNWNVTSTSNARYIAAQRAIFDTFSGRTFSPDVLLIQEVINNVNAYNNLVSLMNNYPGSPGDYAAAPYLTSPDTTGVFLYRTTKVQYLGATLASAGSSNTSQPPRHTYRYDFRPIGYPVGSATIAAYNVHMKAGATTDDEVRRGIEANNIRANAEALDNSWHFIVAGDLNVRTSTDDGIAFLTQSRANNEGRFFDPIASLGNWYQNSSFRFVHTQDPWNGPNAGGMDDRFDFLLTNAGLLDGQGLDYIGNPSIPYSTTTWNDPNHSYRCWGNDGQSYNVPMGTASNQMVGGTIAQALMDSLGNASGHLPVFFDLKVPALSGVSPSYLAFDGQNGQTQVMRSFTVGNVGDVGLWGSGKIAPLTYSLSVTAPYTVPAGPFTVQAGQSITHRVTLPVIAGKVPRGELTITSNDPVNPVRRVMIGQPGFRGRDR